MPGLMLVSLPPQWRSLVPSWTPSSSCPWCHVLLASYGVWFNWILEPNFLSQLLEQSHEVTYIITWCKHDAMRVMQSLYHTDDGRTHAANTTPGPLHEQEHHPCSSRLLTWRSLMHILFIPPLWSWRRSCGTLWGFAPIDMDVPESSWSWGKKSLAVTPSRNCLWQGRRAMWHPCQAWFAFWLQTVLLDYQCCFIQLQYYSVLLLLLHYFHIHLAPLICMFI